MLLRHAHVPTAVGNPSCFHEAYLDAYAPLVHAGAAWYMAGHFCCVQGVRPWRLLRAIARHAGRA